MTLTGDEEFETHDIQVYLTATSRKEKGVKLPCTKMLTCLTISFPQYTCQTMRSINQHDAGRISLKLSTMHSI